MPGTETTLEPACKVHVLSNENWPYKRADLISRLLANIRIYDWDHSKTDLICKKTLYQWTIQVGSSVLWLYIRLAHYEKNAFSKLSNLVASDVIKRQSDFDKQGRHRKHHFWMNVCGGKCEADLSYLTTPSETSTALTKPKATDVVKVACWCSRQNHHSRTSSLS